MKQLFMCAAIVATLLVYRAEVAISTVSTQLDTIETTVAAERTGAPGRRTGGGTRLTVVQHG